MKRNVTFSDSVEVHSVPPRQVSSPTLMTNAIAASESSSTIPDTWTEVSKLQIDGEIKRNHPQSFYLLFETLPIWLLVMLPHEVTQLFVISITSLNASITSAGPLQHLFEDKLFLFKNKLVEIGTALSSLSADCIVLYSGSLEYINTAVASHSSYQGLGIANSYTRIRKSFPPSTVQLHNLSHSRIGGATNFAVVWFLHKIPLFTLGRSLKRNIDHFILHGQRGKAVPSTEKPISTTNTLFSLAEASKLHTYATPSSRSGFARRRLIPQELSDLFGYSHISTFTSDFLRAHAPVPKDMLRFLLNSTLRSLGSSSISRNKLPSMVAFEPSNLKATATYLPSIGRSISTSWSVDRHVESSVKHDDAKENLNFWNRRISLAHTDLLVPTNWKGSVWLVVIYHRVTTVPALQTYGGSGSLFRDRTPIRNGAAAPKRSSRIFYQFICPPFSDTSASLPWLKVLNAGKAIIRAFAAPFCCEEAYMNWLAGSTIIFFRWVPELQHMALLGCEPMIAGTLPTHEARKQRLDSDTRKLVAKKLAKVIKRGYIQLAPRKEIKSFMDYFPVPKGEDDIHMVYNGTTAGLTDVLYAPRFWLPNADTVLRMLHYNFGMVDLDLGEMFLNYPLHEELVPYSGINFESVKKELCEFLGIKKIPDELLGVWLRTWMGLKNSPEWAARFYNLMDEFARADESDLENPFGWDELKLNIIGQPNYDPSLPRVIKWNSLKNRPAGDLAGYVDDLRALGFSVEEAWAIARAIASKVQYLGSQDAPRKRRIDMKGPWTGTIFNTHDDQITKTVAQSKWDKARDYILYLDQEIMDDPEIKLEYKLLEKMRGFFCHLAMTFPIIFPYLKGFHLILSAHQRYRDEEGWKITELEWIGLLEQRIENGSLSREESEYKLHEGHPEPPKMVRVTKKFKQSVKALYSLFLNLKPPVVPVRSNKYLLILHGFVDASKGGFGSTLDLGDKVTYRIGVWGNDSEDESSNWREFGNLVEALEEEESRGTLNGVFAILATDNSTTESAIYKGNSSNEKLFDFILRFRALEMRVAATFLVTQVSGNRMKRQGTDGVLRGRLTEGVSIGELMTEFCPWHKFPLELSDTLLPMLKLWLGNNFEILEPKDWFGRAHDLYEGYRDHNGFWRWKTKKGIFVWNIPAGAASVAIEQLRKAQIKRRESFHILMIPCLCTTEWQRQLYKEADLVFWIQAGADCWPTNCFEKLVIAIVLPFVKHRPWRLQRAPKLCYLEREVRRMLKSSEMATGIVLRKLWIEINKFYSLSEQHVLKMLYFVPKDEIPSQGNSIREEGNERAGKGAPKNSLEKSSTKNG